jgi:ketosteroid isomerase-like protein
VQSPKTLLNPKKDTMKICLLLTLAGFAISFAVPAFAQEQNTVDPEVGQQIEAVLKKFDEAFSKHDAAAIADLFTVDAIEVGEKEWGGGGTVSGQQDIAKRYAADFASSPPDLVSKLVQVYAIGSEVSAISEWIRGGFKGYNVRIYVRAADTWNIRLSYVLPIQNM